MMNDPRAECADIARVVKGETLCRAFAATVDRHGDRDALKWSDSGATQALTWSEYREHVRHFTLGLHALGFEPGSFAVLMGANRPQHVIADLGVVHAGGVPVTAYSSLSPAQLTYILNHCEATLAVVEDGPLLEKLLSIRDNLPHLRRVVLMDERPASGGEWTPWNRVLELGQAHARAFPAAFDDAWQRVRPSDTATLVYTSGTTGPPKGVMLTHANVLWTLEAVRRAAHPTPDDRLISYLPLAHVLERWWSHWNGVIHAVTCHFCNDPRQLLSVLLAVRPTWFFGVPQVWDRLSTGILAAVDSEPDETRREQVKAAIDVGRAAFRAEQSGDDVPPEPAVRADTLKPVLKATLAKIGLDHCTLAVSGSAPISVQALELYRGLGLPLSDGWGMTELTGNGAWGGRDQIRIGTVGRPLQGIEVRVAEDGELLVLGGNVMAGYYKDPQGTAAALEDGWLHTGDLGCVDDDGYVSLLGRKKDIIITPGGKKISPASLENLLERHPLVGHACVVGDGRPYLSALLVLHPEATAGWATAHSMDATSIDTLAADPRVLAEIEQWVGDLNAQVSKPETIRRFKLLPARWTVESGEITPTLKVKRSVIASKYSDIIEEMYR